jgi:hypothetical protein
MKIYFIEKEEMPIDFWQNKLQVSSIKKRSNYCAHMPNNNVEGDEMTEYFWMDA